MKRLLLVLLSLIFLFGCNKNKNELYVYNWTEYIPDEVLDDFQKETGIKVIYSTYDSNELMYSKIKLQKGAGYDIIVPSTYYVDKLAREGLLLELDHSKLPNMKNILPHLLNPKYDKGNKYSLPYMWGTSVLMYNDKYIPSESVKSWKDLWRPEFAGHVLLNNDIREVFQIALMTLGYSGNTTNEKEIEAAYNQLLKLMPSVRVFNSDSPKHPFINEEVRVGLIWNGEAYYAKETNKNLKYVYPKEGAIVWMDCVVIPSGAKNVENAYKFLDYIMQPEVALQIVEEVGYSTPNKGALELMPDKYKLDRLMNPTAEDLKNSQFQEDIGDAILIYNKYWEKLKTSE